MKDATSQLRFATRRAKSDVANKLVSMFLHELSRSISENWPIRVDGEEYEELVRRCFRNRCPYCSCDLATTIRVVEHLDGMNRYRAGLHAPGNVLVACKKCNSEKRRDDSQRVLSLAKTGWESFLSHDGSRCAASCLTCQYWKTVWEDESDRALRLSENLQRIRSFRMAFPEFQQAMPALVETLPASLTKLYSDCQNFAEREMKVLLKAFERSRNSSL
ncbi:MAG: HNH endonuclease signature motif containing protein [Candidatus Acidiferrales bacterium]